MQVRLAKELYGNQIKEIYYTLPYNLIAFSLVDFDWLVHFFPLHYTSYLDFYIFKYQWNNILRC